jgi:hypothetical protein
MRRALIAALCVTTVAACQTRRITEREPIPVPPALKVAQVEQVIRSSLREMRHLSAGFAIGVRPGGWQVESSQPGHIVAVFYSSREYMLKLGIDYSRQAVQTRILGSSGLDQDGNRIHKAAIKWQDALEQRIALNLKMAGSG